MTLKKNLRCRAEAQRFVVGVKAPPTVYLVVETRSPVILTDERKCWPGQVVPLQ